MMSIFEKIFWAGPHPAFQLRYADLVAKFIKSAGLKAASRDLLTGGIIMTEGMPAALSAGPAPSLEKKTVKALQKKDFPGGIREAHLHYNGEIYMLDDRQWKDFSGRIIKDVQNRLSSAGTVNFEQMMRITGAVSGL